MIPTLQDGEFILVNRIQYKFWDIERGDIIVFDHPTVPNQELIKRVIGLPGDMVVIKDGQVLVNGTPMKEDYIFAAPQYDGQWLVPNRNLFVLGDNRNDSSDSHSWGMLPLENIVGKASVIYWPPAEWSLITHNDPLNPN
jgi:signal peptidase I